MFKKKEKTPNPLWGRAGYKYFSMYCVCVLLGPSSHQRRSLKAFHTRKGAGMRVKAPSVALLHTNVCVCTEVGDIFVPTLPSDNSLFLKKNSPSNVNIWW